MYHLFLFLAMFFVACSGPINDTTEDSYTVSVPSDLAGGVVSVSASSFKVGDLVRLEVVPADGMKLKDGSLVYKLSDSSHEVPIRRNSFFMPAGHVKISANFVSLNDTQLSLRNVMDNYIVLQGSAILDTSIVSLAEDLTISWESADESLVTVVPANSTGTRVTLMQVNPGRTSIVGTSSDGSTLTVETTMLPNNLRCNKSGEIIGVTSNFTGGSVIIPNYIDGIEVKAIGEGALSYCGISEITLPEGLVRIGSSALAGNELSSIKLSENLLVVDDNAFEDCPLAMVFCNSSAATKITLGKNAFGSNLEEITVEDGVIMPFRESESWKPYVSKIRSTDSGTIEIVQTQGGSIAVKSGSYEVSGAMLNEIITIEITPDDGWQLKNESIQVRSVDGVTISTDYTEDGTPFFIMPNRDVSVTATFERTILNYTVSHVLTNSNSMEVGSGNNSWGSIFVDFSEDLKTLTISPMPKFGYYLSAVAIENVAAEDIVKDASNQNGNFVADISKSNFTANTLVKITAFWTPKTFSVRLRSQGLSDYVVRNVKYGQTLPSLATAGDIRAPAKIGYKFMGFYSSNNGSGVRYYDSDLNSTQSPFLPTHVDETDTANLIAHFLPNTYQLRITMGKPDDSSAVPVRGGENLNATFTLSAVYNDLLPYVPIPDIEYTTYRFDGYWTVPQNSTEVATKIYDGSGVPTNSSNSWNIPSDTVLEGRWVQKPVTLKFNYNGSTDCKQENILPVERLNFVAHPGNTPPIILMPKPYRTGFHFTGFYDSPVGGVKYYDGNMNTVSTAKVVGGKPTVELYAQWEPRDVTLVFRYGDVEDLKDGTAIAESRENIETTTNVVIDGETVEQIEGKEYETRVWNTLPGDVTSVVTQAPERNCFKFTGFYDAKGQRYYDENLQLDEESISDGLMPPTDLDDFTLVAGWELDGVEIKSSNASAYRSASFAADQTYIFKENVSITGNNNNYGIAIGGTTSNPTNLYIPKGVTVTIQAGSRNVSRYSRTTSGSSSTTYLVSYVTGVSSSSSGPAPGVEMYCYTSDGERSTWQTTAYPFEGGKAGINVTSGKCLRVFGQGTLKAAGSDGIDAYGACDSPRMNADTSGVKCEAHNEYRAYGASGGAGASGGGAGIGGNGGNGTSFNLSPYYSSSHTGSSGQSGGTGGYMYFYGDMTIYARGGLGGSYGYGSSGGKGREIGSHDDHSGAGGAGGGGAGGAGAGVGGGGGGGGAGGYGGNGIVDNESSDGDSGSHSNGSNGMSGESSKGYGVKVSNANLRGNGGSGFRGGSGGSAGGYNSSHSYIGSKGGTPGSGGSAGSYSAIVCYDNAQIKSW